MKSDYPVIQISTVVSLITPFLIVEGLGFDVYSSGALLKSCAVREGVTIPERVEFKTPEPKEYTIYPYRAVEISSPTATYNASTGLLVSSTRTNTNALLNNNSKVLTRSGLVIFSGTLASIRATLAQPITLGSGSSVAVQYKGNINPTYLILNYTDDVTQYCYFQPEEVMFVQLLGRTSSFQVSTQTRGIVTGYFNYILSPIIYT